MCVCVCVKIGGMCGCRLLFICLIGVVSVDASLTRHVRNGFATLETTLSAATYDGATIKITAQSVTDLLFESSWQLRAAEWLPYGNTIRPLILSLIKKIIPTPVILSKDKLRRFINNLLIEVIAHMQQQCSQLNAPHKFIYSKSPNI